MTRGELHALLRREVEALETIADSLRKMADGPQVRVNVEAAPQVKPDWPAHQARALQHLLRPLPPK